MKNETNERVRNKIDESFHQWKKERGRRSTTKLFNGFFLFINQQSLEAKWQFWLFFSSEIHSWTRWVRWNTYNYRKRKNKHLLFWIATRMQPHTMWTMWSQRLIYVFGVTNTIDDAESLLMKMKFFEGNMIIERWLMFIQLFHMYRTRKLERKNK